MEADFAFAFNNASFSDRLLRIEITGGGGEVSCSGIVDGKRRRLDLNSDTHHHGYESYSEPKVTELHISSPILAAKSPFFFKLFSNGMRESQQRHVTLNIHASEEAAVMELLNFMYTNSLSVTTAPALLDVLMAADKFEVASCIDYCTRLLLSMPMTVDHALLLLDLPSSVVATASVEPLTIAARQFLASYYQDFHKFSEKEVIALPLVGIEAVLASDKLEIMSEDYLYDFVLKWAKIHYSDLQECQEVLGSRLACYIRFPHMTCSKLKKIMSSNDFRPHVASSLVLEALFSKAESMHRQHVLPTERAYLNRPIQVVRFEVPRHQCIVYLDLKHKECSRLNPHGLIYSQVFLFGGHGFVLYAHRKFHCFRLYLKVLGKEPVSLTVEYEFAARSKPKNEFVSICNGNFDFTGGKSVGHRNLFLIPSESFIATDCPYFINEILHLRADLSIRL